MKNGERSALRNHLLHPRVVSLIAIFNAWSLCLRACVRSLGEAIDNSPGREPWDEVPRATRAPQGRQKPFDERDFCRPSGAGNRDANRTQGLRPGLHAYAPAGLNGSFSHTLLDRPAHEKRAARTGLRVVARFSPIQFMLGICRPTIRVDGRSYRASWGQYEYIDVGPGMHSVEASFSHPLRRKAGWEKIYLTVSRGQVRRLEYKAPQLAFLRGTFRELPMRK